MKKFPGLPILLTVLLGFSGYGQDFTPANSIVSLQARAIQPAGSPLLFTITAKNVSKKPITYWNGGPGTYPNASDFSATVTDRLGSTRPVLFENWQYTMGSGRNVKVKPSASLDLPAASDPLPPGTYSFSVEGSHPIQIVVRSDAQLEQSYENRLLAGLRRDKPFYQQVAAHYKNEKIGEILLQDLLSNDLKVAGAAASSLIYFRENLPKNSDLVCAQALTKNISASATDPQDVFPGPRIAIFVSLVLILAECRSDFALESVIGLADSSAINKYADEGGQGNQVRLQAVNALSQFPQPRVLNLLRGFLSDHDSMVQFAAAGALANRRDPVALEFLLILAASPNQPSRGESFNELVQFYPQDARVEAVLKKASRDHNPTIRSMAKEGLKQLDEKHQESSR